MTPALARLAGFVDDRLNPIVVKELRQAVQGRFVAAVLLLFLLVELAVLTVFLLTADPAESIDWAGGSGRGPDVFAFIVGFLLFVTIVTLPAYAAVRLFVEQANDSLSLVFVTTLPPRRIVAGKLAATQVLALVLFAACLPFVSFSYFLRGIDLPSILVVFTFSFVVVTVAAQAAILVACLPSSRFLKIALGLAGLVGLVLVFSATFTGGMTMISAGVGSNLDSSDFWLPAGVFLGIAGVLVTLGYLAAVALVSPAVANRAPPVRRFLSWTWLASGALVALGAWRSADDDALGVWTVTWTAAAVTAGVVATGAPDAMSRRVAQKVPRRRWRRAVAFFLWSGSANGMAWAAALALLSAAAAYLVARGASWRLGEWWHSAVGFAGYGFAYSTLGLLVHRRFLARRVPRRYTWVVAVLLAALGSVLPPVVGFLAAPEAFAGTSDALVWTLLNPFAPFFNAGGAAATWFALLWAAAMAALALPWFRRQVRAFAPPALPAAGENG